ncbi:hypothetical protein [Elizabethkingia bruuniana]|uniref:Caspase family p20 domain-containing protein n=1 Tax=Elizabethkingia bruuniana TaxID=1756149 RepID=A0A7T7ZYR6_9FLAO|nr:hypothetical protein [Elizabethkingia bruuniana]KGO09693.1 hypothetical protein KS04_13355 [Elizabethkingia miricola]AQX85739.1 hypothetical protein AYC65_12305 [Elizabethkingia bruuniana]KUY22840.1 hypothetical protein ATB97_11650 [Elizabethkingia bruuniana]OPB68715.1 hypothetical protein BAY12_00780 [Elizabethkingia bruuniana]QDZ61910.1 hypothetical protein EVD20_01890 [Elizabethkingia bruuniana]
MASVIISKPSRPQPIYGFDNITNGDEVTELVKYIRKNLGPQSMNKVMIYILSGTHGDTQGNLVGEDDFYQEDKLVELQTVKAVRANEKTPTNTWANYFGKTNSILILAWCYSNRWSGLTTYNK